MTLFEKTMDLAKRGYSVTVGDDLGDGIVIGISYRHLVSTSHAYSFEQMDLGIFSTEWLILQTIDKLVEKIDREVLELKRKGGIEG